MGYSAGAQHQSGNVSLSGAALQKIYLTTDKVIYTPNEQLWFAAYLFEDRLLVKDTSDVLTLGLYDPVSDGMVAIKKFPIHNRIATGNLLLPDTLVAGQYNLVAYTNLLDTQHVPIGTGFKPLRIYARTGDKAFTTSLKISDSLSTKDRIAILHEIIPESYQVTFKDARASYQLAGGRFRTLELNNYGNGIIYMDLKDVKKGNRSLSVTTVYNGDTARNRIRIPEVSDRPGDWSAAFYPEGGFLAAGYTNRIFWEVTHKNVASSSRALLLENDQVIDTIETLANGASAFNVNAKAGKQYAVTLDLKNQGMERFMLPPVNPDGIQIEIPRMIVNDTLSIELWSKEKKTVRLIVSDITGLISVHQLDINSYKKLAVILDEFARGLCKVFVVDSKNKILAKSYFFAHYKSRNRLDLQTDRDVYKIRDSVLLSIDINNSNGNPLNSMATVSCALLSRIDFNLAKSIESDHDFSSVIYNEPVFIKRRNVLDSSDLLEHIIRMKNMNDDDSVFLAGIPQKSLLKPAVQLQLARFGKQVKKQMDLVLLRDGNFSLLKTDEQGALPLSTDELLVKDGRKLSIKGMIKAI